MRLVQFPMQFLSPPLPLSPSPHPRTPHRLLAILLSALLGQSLTILPASASATPYCQQLPEAIAQKDKLRAAAIRGDQNAQKRYKDLLKQHATRLRDCRKQTWPQTQALWIRLYACDTRAGVLEQVLDRIVNRGYNQINVEVFYNGRVLLPANANPTAWASVLAGTGADNVDLLARVIQKGRERGLKVYAWLFSMNVGADYVRRPEKLQTLAQNGLGQNSLTANTVAGLSVEMGLGNPDEAFADPYSPLVRQDYTRMVQAIAQRKPDGMLFDYIRYPRGYGSASVASRVQDLWIYGEASRQVLLQRALNYKGMELIQRYLNRGYLKVDDLKDIQQLYPKEPQPLWQGLDLPKSVTKLPLGRQVTALQAELWELSVAHAAQGVLDFLTMAIAPAQQLGIPTGAVFFPEGNLSVGQGFDSRLQPWDRFPTGSSWQPMSYGVCGSVSCIVSQVQRVIQQSPPRVQIIPVLAGIWQQSVSNRPPLEQQMTALYRYASSIKAVSHFAYSWQEPGSDRDRKFCTLR
jgi:hypothetical protein